MTEIDVVERFVRVENLILTMFFVIAVLLQIILLLSVCIAASQTSWRQGRRGLMGKGIWNGKIHYRKTNRLIDDMH
jgi:hypothetical protein